MGAAAAIMIVCDNKAGRGGRGGNRSATGVAGQLRGDGGPGGGMLPAPRVAADVPGDDRGDADGCGAGELLDAGRSPRSRRSVPPSAFPGPCGVGPRCRARPGGPLGRASTRRRPGGTGGGRDRGREVVHGRCRRRTPILRHAGRHRPVPGCRASHLREQVGAGPRRPGAVPDAGLGGRRRTPRADRSPGRAGVRDQAPAGRHDAGARPRGRHAGSPGSSGRGVRRA